ncbi:Uma2 family endonuclease [Gemmata sp.]|uniref:Uma2 family endonuclease n=1 Tax=Gemmata sp. TaxID=1914242 RepID=UPI003F703055
MSTAPATTPPAATRPRHYLARAAFRKFTLAEYHKMIAQGVLQDGEPYELLEGNLVLKMSRGSPHDSALQALFKRLLRLVPPGWDARGQSAITLPTGSEPEPDVALVRGDENTFRKRHPGPGEIGVVVEVSDSSLLVDRDDKGSIYAENGIPVYWVVNVPDRVIEVYTQPVGSGTAAAYAQRTDYAAGALVPFVLDGATVGSVAVSDVFG